MVSKRKPSVPVDPNLVWKIRRKKDGYFSEGRSQRPSFSKDGRFFSSQKKVILHLRRIEFGRMWYRKNNRPLPAHPYLGCEIVQFRINEEVAVSFEGYGE